MAHCDAGKLSLRQRKGLRSCRTRAEEQRSADRFLAGLAIVTLIMSIITAVYCK
jgi:hypothetical protein